MEELVGIFFTEKFKGEEWPIVGDRFKDFPEAFGSLLKHPRLRFYESKACG